MNSSKVIFLTGATGYLGSHILPELLACGHRVYCLRRKSSNLWRVDAVSSKVSWVDMEDVDFNAFFSKYKIELILHCATDYGRKNISPIQTVEANLILPLKMLHAAVKQGVSCFINTDTVLDKRINHYSLSKKQFVEWLEAYSGSILGVNVALEHFYGPDDDSSKFVTYIIQSLLSNVPRIELTEGYQKRDFIYIDDVVSAFIRLIDSSDRLSSKFHSFEVGSGASIEIREFIQLVKKMSGNENTCLEFGAIPYRENEVMCSSVDTLGLRKLGWKPSTTLEQGIMKVINFDKKRC